MKKMKSVLSLLLALLTLAALPLSAFAAEMSDAERAERFLATVDRLENCSGLVECEAVYLEAMSEDIYFDDESYEGVTEALLALEEIRVAIETSVAFVNAVDRLSETEEQGYAALRALLDEAGGYYDSLTDKSYTGVSGAYEKYSATLSALRTREQYTAEIILLARELKLTEVYRDIDYLVTEIKNGMRNDAFISDHPDAAEITSTLEAANAAMRAAVIKANAFIRAVEKIRTGEGYFDAILVARDALVGVDTTVSGASAAKRSYEDSLSDYKRSAERVNATFN